MLCGQRRGTDRAAPDHGHHQPAAPITGSRGTLEGKGKGKGKGRIVGASNNSLVDNSFSVPGATGCGGSLSAVIDLAVDADVGIPALAGLNTAVMNGTLEETTAAYAAKYKPKPKKEKRKSSPAKVARPYSRGVTGPWAVTDTSVPTGSACSPCTRASNSSEPAGCSGRMCSRASWP
jgi:hypothetical protein